MLDLHECSPNPNAMQEEHKAAQCFPVYHSLHPERVPSCVPESTKTGLEEQNKLQHTKLLAVQSMESVNSSKSSGERLWVQSQSFAIFWVYFFFFLITNSWSTQSCNIYRRYRTIFLHLLLKMWNRSWLALYPGWFLYILVHLFRYDTRFIIRAPPRISTTVVMLLFLFS